MPSDAPISTEERERLGALLQGMIAAYQHCSKERGQLSAREFAAGPDQISLLGSVEMWADSIAGFVMPWIHKRRFPALAEVIRLRSFGVWDLAVVRSWQSDSTSFPAYAAYLNSIEALRSVALEVALAATGGPDA